MGVGYSSCSLSLALPHCTCFASTALVSHKSKPNSSVNPSSNFFQTHYPRLTNTTLTQSSSFSALFPVKCGRAEEIKIQQDKSTKSTSDIDPELLQRLVYDSLVWSSLHGLVVGDKSVQRSGTVPGVGMVHAPFALLPMSFPESHWRQACELAPIFNELVDRVSLDGNFLQESLSRTKQADAFTSRLLDIHSKMLENGKKEEIRLGLHRSDYMLDEQTKLLLQIELNTISSSFPGLSCLVSELHKLNKLICGSADYVPLYEIWWHPFPKSLLNQFKEHLGLDSRRIPGNTAVSRFAVALAKAWKEYNNPSFVTHMMLQLFGKHWQKLMRKGCFYQMEPFSLVIRQLQSFISELGMRQSESEWRARQLMEQSSAIKCPSISYHSVSTKKIQQELAKTNVLERFLENKDDIAKLRKCFAGLWSLDDSNTVTDAIERPEFYAMKPQREGGGINIYGDDVRKTLLRLQMEGTEEDAAYILMQRIFPTIAPTFLMRDGICYKDHAISELGVYSTYLRNKENVIMNEQCGYLIRTKVSSSNEGGVAAGFAVLDSVYLA